MKKSEQTKINLIAAGISLFSDFDYNKVSTRDITKKANTCLGGLFYHYGTKEKLYLEVINYIIDNNHLNFDEIYNNNFENYSIEQMQIYITNMITLIDNEFKTNHGICFSNILQREILNKSNTEANKIINIFVTKMDAAIHKTLLIYYTKYNLPTNKTRFIMAIMFSILKNPMTRVEGFYKDQEQSILNNLIELVLYQKLS